MPDGRNLYTVYIPIIACNGHKCNTNFTFRQTCSLAIAVISCYALFISFSESFIVLCHSGWKPTCALI